MNKDIKSAFLSELAARYGKTQRFGDSYSLYKIEGSEIRIYIRYSRMHPGGKTWYGLRKSDLQQLEGYPSVLCFLWDGQEEPLLVPYAEYEDLFQTMRPADDGQFKLQVILQEGGTELYIARAGRFNVEGYFGWTQLDNYAMTDREKIPDLSHSQIQTLIGSIGAIKNFDIWIPPVDRVKLDWVIASPFGFRENLPQGLSQVEPILHEVDVIWLQRGSNELKALFEIEHSTPIYSGLLRFNDVHLVAPDLRPRFSVVANGERRSLFVRQINRATFRTSGLSELCTFLEYVDVYSWHKRVSHRDKIM